MRLPRDRHGRPHWLVSVALPALVSGLIVVGLGLLMLRYLPGRYLLPLGVTLIFGSLVWRTFRERRR